MIPCATAHFNRKSLVVACEVIIIGEIQVVSCRTFGVRIRVDRNKHVEVVCFYFGSNFRYFTIKVVLLVIGNIAESHIFLVAVWVRTAFNMAHNDVLRQVKSCTYAIRIFVGLVLCFVKRHTILVKSFKQFKTLAQVGI